MPENPPEPIKDAVDDVLLRVLPTEVIEACNELRKHYQELIKDVRKRHRGAARNQLLKQHEADLEKKLNELVQGAIKKPGA